MVEEDLGEATIVYEGPDGETESQTVQNEHVAYFQDHWILKTGEDDRGRDLVRRIPSERVYHVERTVEQFEEEVSTLRDQVESVADDLRTRILGSGSSSSGDERNTTTESTSRSESVSIDVTSGEGDDADDGDEFGDGELGDTDDSLGSDAGERDDEDDPLGRNS